MSFTVNCFRRTEVKCIKNNGTLARVRRQRCSCCHNCSEHNNRNCPSFRQNNACGGRWLKLGFDLHTGGVSEAPAAAVGVALAPAAAVAGIFQLPSHREPPQTTVHEHCERRKRTISFPTQTRKMLRNVHIKKCTADSV